MPPVWLLGLGIPRCTGADDVNSKLRRAFQCLALAWVRGLRGAQPEARAVCVPDRSKRWIQLGLGRGAPGALEEIGVRKETSDEKDPHGNRGCNDDGWRRSGADQPYPTHYAHAGPKGRAASGKKTRPAGRQRSDSSAGNRRRYGYGASRRTQIVGVSLGGVRGGPLARPGPSEWREVPWCVRSTPGGAWTATRFRPAEGTFRTVARAALRWFQPSARHNTDRRSASRRANAEWITSWRPHQGKREYRPHFGIRRLRDSGLPCCSPALAPA